MKIIFNVLKIYFCGVAESPMVQDLSVQSPMFRTMSVQSPSFTPKHRSAIFFTNPEPCFVKPRSQNPVDWSKPRFTPMLQRSVDSYTLILEWSKSCFTRILDQRLICSHSNFLVECNSYTLILDGVYQPTLYSYGGVKQPRLHSLSRHSPASLEVDSQLRIP